MLFEIIILINLFFLLLASIEDLKTGEIPEKYSMGMLGFNLLGSALLSLHRMEFNPLINTLLWGLIAFIIGYAIFILGQWGGGDVKILAGVGALIGLMDSLGFQWPNPSFVGFEIPTLATYLVNMAFLSTPYVMLYTMILGIRQPKVFRVYLARIVKPRFILMFTFSICPLILSSYYGLHKLSFVYSLVPLFILAAEYLKTVEETLLKKTIRVDELSSWDILCEDVYVDSKKIAVRKNIEGVTPEQVSLIKKASEDGKLPEFIDIRWGVKFAPILLLSLIVTVYAGNLLEEAFRMLILFW
jgi:hypothetical protein